MGLAKMIALIAQMDSNPEAETSGSTKKGFLCDVSQRNDERECI